MEKKQTFSVHTERDVKLTVEDIDDIMVAALEGGINYWCSEAEVVEERRCADWGHEQIARGGALVLHDVEDIDDCLLYTSPSPRDMRRSRMPSSA